MVFRLGSRYSRWLPVFLRTMEELSIRHPGMYDAFMNGHFTSRRTDCAFSAISNDQLHGQNNKLIKGDGGAIVILDNELVLLKWMVSGPEISKIVQEFELTIDKENVDNIEIHHHHEANKSFQSRFIRHVSAVVESVLQDGNNPFSEQDLQTTDTQKILMTASAENSVFEAHKAVQQKLNNFVEDLLIFGRTSLREALQKTNLALFAGSKKPRNSNLLKITDF